MSDLIPLSKRDGIETVNARDLHVFLGVGERFNDWIARQIDAYGFADGKDFTCFTEPAVKPSGGRPAKEYALTLDMAKELSMVSRTDRGREARQYFIDCERRAKDPVALLSDPAALRGLLGSYAERVETLEATVATAQIALNQSQEHLSTAQGRVEELQPKAAALDRLSASDGTFNVTEAAKMLGVQPKKLFAWLQEKHWLYQRPGSPWLGYQDKVQSGLLEHKTTTVARSDGTEKTAVQVRVTAKGMAKLGEIIGFQPQPASLPVTAAPENSASAEPEPEKSLPAA